MHLVFSKILKYALQTFLRFDSNVPPQIQNSLLFMVHIHMIYTGFTHFCREISLVAITRFGRHFLAKIGGRRHTNILEDRGCRCQSSLVYKVFLEDYYGGLALMILKRSWGIVEQILGIIQYWE